MLGEVERLALAAAHVAARCYWGCIGWVGQEAESVQEAEARNSREGLGGCLVNASRGSLVIFRYLDYATVYGCAGPVHDLAQRPSDLGQMSGVVGRRRYKGGIQTSRDRWLNGFVLRLVLFLWNLRWIAFACLALIGVEEDPGLPQ